MDRVGIIVQARMGSTRLRGKVLLPLAGKPLLHRLCDRMKLSREAAAVVVATSDRPADLEIESACRMWGIPVFRGPEMDVTTRLLGAAREHDMTALVRVTADNPLTDPEGIDRMIELFKKRRPGMVFNNHRLGYPCGTGAEVMARSVLETYDQWLTSPDDREIVFSIARTQPERCTALTLDPPPELFRPQYFLTVDYPEDVDFMNAVYGHFDGRDDVRLSEIIHFLDSNPTVALLNRHLHSGLSQ